MNLSLGHGILGGGRQLDAGIAAQGHMALTDRFQPGTWPSIPGVSLNQASQLSYPNAFNNNTTERFQLAQNTLWKMSVMDDSEWLTSVILPKRKVEGTTIMMNITKMEPTLMEPNPEWAQAKLVSMSRMQKITRLERWGLQLEIEVNFAQDPYGQEAFNLYIFTIQRAMEDTFAVDVIAELLNAPNETQRKVLKDNRYRGHPPWNAMQAEILYYHALQKLNNPLESLDAKISEEMAAVGGKFNTLILPSQARAYVKTSKNQYLDYSHAGPAGPALARSDIHLNGRAGAYPGIGDSIQIYSVKRTHAMNALTGGRDIMSSEMSVGEYYVVQSAMEWDDEHWTPECQAIKLYDEERGDYKHIRLEDVLARSQLFDDQGKVRSLADLPEDAPPNYKTAVEGVDDMFSDEAGNPILLFGQIREKYLPAVERVKWARGFLNRGMMDATEKAALTKVLKEIQEKSEEAGPQDYSAVKGVDVAVKPLLRCFPDSVYLTPAAIPSWSSGKDANDAFVHNLLIPNYLPVYLAGGDMANIKSATALQLLTQLYSDPDDAFAAIAAAAGKGSAEYAAELKKVRPAIQLYALRSLSQDAKYAKPKYADNMAGVQKLYDDFKGNKQLAKQVEEKAVTVIENVGRGGWAGDNAKFSLVKDKQFSPKQVHDVYVEWRDNPNPAFVPQYVPGDPDYPGIPISKDKLFSYFENEEMRQKSPWKSNQISSAFHAQTPYVSSLVSQHVRSLQSAEEHGHQEHAESHAFIAARGSPQLFGMIESSRQSTIGGYYGPGRFSQDSSSDLLVSLTSDSYVTLMNDVSEMATPFERIVSQLFNVSVFKLSTLKRWSQCGLPLPFAGLLFRPNITHVTAHGIAVWRGEETGYTAIGKPLWMYGANPGTQSQMGHFTVYSKAIIEQTQNVYVIPNIMITGYVRGNSCDWIDPRKERQNTSSVTESLYGVIIPIPSCKNDLRPVISITGETSHLLRFQELGVAYEAPFPQATRFVKTFGTWSMYVDSSGAEENGIPLRNVLCLEGQYLKYGPNGFKDMHPGQGHLENTNGPKAKMVRSGGLLAYNTDFGGINQFQ